MYTVWLAESGMPLFFLSTSHTTKLMLSLSPVVTPCTRVPVFLCCSSFRKPSFARLPEAQLIQTLQTKYIKLMLTDCQPTKPSGLSYFVRTNILASHGNLPIVWTTRAVVPHHLSSISVEDRRRSQPVLPATFN